MKKEEGGRKKPIMNGYIQPLLTKTWNVDCHFNLPKDKEMLLGGDYANINLTLKYPMVILEGDKFTSKHNLKNIFNQIFT